MDDLLNRIPTIDWTLALAVAAAGFVALVSRRRGGRFRALPGWSGFWVGYAIILICLSRASRWVSYPLLAILMFVSFESVLLRGAGTTPRPLRGPRGVRRDPDRVCGPRSTAAGRRSWRRSR